MHIYKYTYICIQIHTLSRAAFLPAIAEEYFAVVSSASALANAGTSPRASARTAASAAPPPTPPTLIDSFCLHDVLCAFQCALSETVINKLDGSRTIIFECGVYVCTYIHVYVYTPGDSSCLRDDVCAFQCSNWATVISNLHV